MAKKDKSDVKEKPISKKASKEEKIRHQEEERVRAELLSKKQSFQDLFPVKDIFSQCFVDAQGYYYPCIKLDAINYDLASEDEKMNLESALNRFFNSIDFHSFQIIIVPMPHDITAWQRDTANKIAATQKEIDRLSIDISANRLNMTDLEYLEKKDRMEQLAKQIEILKIRLDYLISKLQTGEVSTKSAYLIPFYDDKQQGDRPYIEILDSARQAITQYNSLTGTKATLCNEREMMNLLLVELDPYTTQINKIVRDNYTRYVGGDLNGKEEQ